MFGKLHVMNGAIGLALLGATAPYVDQTRNDELLGSSPAGRHQQPFLTPNWSLLATQPRLSRTTQGHLLPSDEKTL